MGVLNSNSNSNSKFEFELSTLNRENMVDGNKDYKHWCLYRIITWIIIISIYKASGICCNCHCSKYETNFTQRIIHQDT